jgi:hypothetical protein
MREEGAASSRSRDFLLVAFQCLLVTNTTRREAGGAAAMRRVWVMRLSRRTIGRLMAVSRVDLPAHLCPNWGPTTFDHERATTNGALPSDETTG